MGAGRGRSKPLSVFKRGILRAYTPAKGVFGRIYYIGFLMGRGDVVVKVHPKRSVFVTASSSSWR